jgi:hypothetical protein
MDRPLGSQTGVQNACAWPQLKAGDSVTRRIRDDPTGGQAKTTERWQRPHKVQNYSTDANGIPARVVYLLNHGHHDRSTL